LSVPLTVPTARSEGSTTERTASAARTPAPLKPGEVVPARATVPEPAAPDLPGPLSLAQLEQLAQAHNPILQRDLAKLDSARGQALQASLYPNPNFDGGNPETIAGRNTTLVVGVSQEIVTRGKLKLDTAAAEQQVRQAELTYNQNRLQLLTDVRKQYFAVMVDRRRVEVLSELLKIVQAALETGRELEKAGQASTIDTLLLAVDAQQVQANLQRSRTL